MKKGLTRLLLVMIALTLIMSTIPAYEPYAEQNVPPAEAAEQGTPEQTEVVEEPTGNEVQQDTQVVAIEGEGTPSAKVDGDWKDPYYENVRKGRSVAPEKPEKAIIKTASNGVGTGTGAMNLSWKAMPGATGYKVIIGNGYNYEYFSVGNVTSWTTKGKGIFPTKAELDKGLYRFHTDGKGTEFANDPTQLYENTFKAGTTWTLRGQKKYIVRILAIYASGDGPTSDITEAVMSPETLPAKPEKSVIKTTSSGAGTGTGHMDISWQAVSGAIDYKVVISNGYNYEYFNTGNVTSWSTKGKKIFPTQAEIANKQYKFHQDGKGVEFASDPRALYENGYQAGSTFGLRNQKKYIVRILAVYPWGDGPTSDITDAIMPIEQMAKPSVTSHRSENDENTGYLNVSWQPVTDAISYRVGVFNGFNYQYVNVGKTTNWSTQGKKLWASDQEIENGNYQLHTDGTGSELPLDPIKTYTAANLANPNVNYSDRLFYYTRVVAVFNEGESPVSDAATLTMPLGEISNIEINTNGLDATHASMDFYWDESESTEVAGYKVWIFDGKNYQAFDVKENTSWTSEDKGIWPTNNELEQGKYEFHYDEEGEDLSIFPNKVYAYNGVAYSNSLNYYTRITAYNQFGSTIAYSQNQPVQLEKKNISRVGENEKFDVDNVEYIDPNEVDLDTIVTEIDKMEYRSTDEEELIDRQIEIYENYEAGDILNEEDAKFVMTAQKVDEETPIMETRIGKSSKTLSKTLSKYSTKVTLKGTMYQDVQVFGSTYRGNLSLTLNSGFIKKVSLRTYHTAFGTVGWSGGGKVPKIGVVYSGKVSMSKDHDLAITKMDKSSKYSAFAPVRSKMYSQATVTTKKGDEYTVTSPEWWKWH